jgi:hypothetical protein
VLPPPDPQQARHHFPDLMGEEPVARKLKTQQDPPPSIEPRCESRIPHQDFRALGRQAVDPLGEAPTLE